MSRTNKFFNILLKGRSGSEGPPPEVMAKMMCNNIIYAILANDDPYEYPGLGLGQKISTYYSKDGACTKSSGYGMSVTVKNCDCSDPTKYNFEDKGRFKI